MSTTWDLNPDFYIPNHEVELVFLVSSFWQLAKLRERETAVPTDCLPSVFGQHEGCFFVLFLFLVLVHWLCPRGLSCSLMRTLVHSKQLLVQISQGLHQLLQICRECRQPYLHYALPVLAKKLISHSLQHLGRVCISRLRTTPLRVSAWWRPHIRMWRARLVETACLCLVGSGGHNSDWKSEEGVTVASAGVKMPTFLALHLSRVHSNTVVPFLHPQSHHWYRGQIWLSCRLIFSTNGSRVKESVGRRGGKGKWAWKLTGGNVPDPPP